MTEQGETSLSAERTRLSYERTMMSWIRTGTSLISFGFTLYKFFQIELLAKQAPQKEYLVGPTQFALAMIIIGLLSLWMGTWEHRRQVKALRAKFPQTPRSLAIVLAVLVSMLGILALVLVIFRQ